jgi:hypothetical protein
MALKRKIEAIGVDTVMKIFNQLIWVLEAQVLCGGFIQETDFKGSLRNLG